MLFRRLLSESEPPPLRADSLWRTLARGCELGMFIRTGAGNKAETFRYGLTGSRAMNKL